MANVKKCALVVRDKDKVNPGEFQWEWAEDELPLVDLYASAPLAASARQSARHALSGF